MKLSSKYAKFNGLASYVYLQNWYVKVYVIVPVEFVTVTEVVWSICVVLAKSRKSKTTQSEINAHCSMSKFFTYILHMQV